MAAAAAVLVVAAGVVLALALGRGNRRGPAPTARSKPHPQAVAPGAERRRTAHRASGLHGLEIALQDNAVFLERGYYDRDVAFRQARELGVTWMRTNLLWSRVQPTPGGFDWSQYDSLVDTARRHGVSVEMSLTGPVPAWASGDGRVGPFRPDPVAFRRFARAAAMHFRNRVTRYSIWNEPNHDAWLTPAAEAPAIYRRLYEAGWSAIKAADPHAEVLFGETGAYAEAGQTAPLAFLRAVACRGCPELHADGYAHHPYEFTDPPEFSYPGADNVTIGTLGRLETALDELAAKHLLATPDGKPLPIYLTEFGYFASGRRALPASVRADWTVRAYAIALKMYPRVRQMLQYLLVSPPAHFPGGYFDTSIVSLSGRPEEPFAAVAAWASRERRAGRVAR